MFQDLRSKIRIIILLFLFIKINMIDIFHDFYRGKRVLVTGHTGFKGSWLSIWLHGLGAEVIGVAQDPFTDVTTLCFPVSGRE